ncbi:unnamed protein product [Rotaria socialis]|uniref:ADP ribosyltransferase domain-containing protein n=2 Tax=Rotaria socialis TaxID=392032 RepID=A0A821MC17_9BILA|nr:unnamed protein product [Rotaria socialis]CAF4765138.1 unnamed protein product [Rotaria socialis]
MATGSQQLREDRFSSAIKPTAPRSFAQHNTANSGFISRWLERNNGAGMAVWNSSLAVEQVVKGITLEAKALNKKAEEEAQNISRQLVSVKNKTQEEIKTCCMRIYTRETFLYKLLNTVLRNEDMSKVDTLGAYCWLVDSGISPELGENQACDLTVYRGMNLTQNMIQKYKQAIGKTIEWLGFTSTTKNRTKAAQFGTTLFIVHISVQYYDDYGSCHRDISSLSDYPNEEEVLLSPSHRFKVDRVQRDSNSGKHTIYLSYSPEDGDFFEDAETIAGLQE